MPAFSLVSLHSWITPLLRRGTTLPYPSVHTYESHSFGGVLEPRYIVGAESLDQ